MKYIKQLDSLRAIAVIIVIIHHWSPIDSMLRKVPGVMGVYIFFVISGFLISKILFDYRNKSDLNNIPKSLFLKNFYGRRTLRIFPIYYLTILILLIFSKETGTNIKADFIYYAAYISNFHFFNVQAWDGILSHLWSLAVEEQFYLIWPWLILFVNKKYFLHLIIFFILIGLVSQLFLAKIEMSVVLTFTCLDALGLGALLAWVITYQKEKLRKFYLIISIILMAMLLILILVVAQQKSAIIYFRSLISFMTVWVISYILLNRETDSLRFKFILNNKVLIFLGKISYGLYLYHIIIPKMLNSNIINVYINPLLPDSILNKYWEHIFLFENIILLIVFSWLSYILIEKRFLNMKKYFVS